MGCCTKPPLVVVVVGNMSGLVVVGARVFVAMPPIAPVQAAFIGQQATCPTASLEQTCEFLQQRPGAPMFPQPLYPSAHPDCLFTSSRLSSTIVSFCTGSCGSRNSVIRFGEPMMRVANNGRAARTCRILSQLGSRRAWREDALVPMLECGSQRRRAGQRWWVAVNNGQFKE